MYTRPVSERQDLVGKPTEREWLELKSWIDPGKRHLPHAQISQGILLQSQNYGGGYLVFGFNDDGTRCAPKNDVRKLYGHDVIGGIIDRYLVPKFQCDVHFETSANVEHPIVWIPSHGTLPVISKADGPQNDKGRREGISSGLVYIRTPKPESLPITTPEQWDKLIQRCVLARRNELVSMFSAIVSGGIAPPAKPDRDKAREKLASWHSATQKAFIDEIANTGLKPRYPLTENFVQFSYAIRHRDGAQLSTDQALTIVEKLNSAIRDTVRYGWSMFYPFTRPEISPRFMTDPAVDDGATEFLQASLIEGTISNHVDFWRISMDGRASLIRNFHEDRFPSAEEIANGQKWFDPRLQVRDITEVVRHAWALSEEFVAIEEICFQFEWRGLKSRVTATANHEYSVRPFTSQTDRRVVSSCFTQAEVIGNLPAVVSNLYAPVERLFNPHAAASPEWVSSLMGGFIVPGL